MTRRKEPKAKKLKHWYRLTQRLADQCDVRSWTHHYRTYNKMADGGANYAMDKKQSVMVNWALQPNPHPLQAVILAAIDGGITQANERLQSI
ncbi:unnamed protein product [Phytophthora lilii]|uniref:Unnamed protein product n=1 Tax=Phytophthora lilii TaxID=2077276 RepID=A0A9W7CM32_9STRA|nr:unnamed protein product [Phytophthora lilii]